MNTTNLRLFAAEDQGEVTKRIADILGTELSPLVVRKFENGEEKIQLGDSVNGRDVFFIQRTSQPTHNFVRALQLIDAARRAGASRITLIDPMMGWARQDRPSQKREPVTARLIVSALEAAGLKRYVTVDIHKDQIAGFFKIPAYLLYARRILLSWLQEQKLKNMVVVVPDEGASKMASWYVKELGVRRVYLDKQRAPDGTTTINDITGELGPEDTAIIVDDLIDTGGTMINTIETLHKQYGVERFYVLATHGEFSGNAIDRLATSPVTKIVFTDTIKHSSEKEALLQKNSDKFVIVSVAPLLAEAIRRIHEGSGHSVTSLSE